MSDCLFKIPKEKVDHLTVQNGLEMTIEKGLSNPNPLGSKSFGNIVQAQKEMDHLRVFPMDQDLGLSDRPDNLHPLVMMCYDGDDPVQLLGGNAFYPEDPIAEVTDREINVETLSIIEPYQHEDFRRWILTEYGLNRCVNR